MNVKQQWAAVASLFKDLALVSEALNARLDELSAALAGERKAPAPSPPTREQKPPKTLDGESVISNTERKILTALAQSGRVLSAVQIGIWSGLRHSTGSFSKALADLRKDGCISGPNSALQITDEGLEFLGEFARLPEGHALFDYWCRKVGGTGAKILKALKPLSAHEHLSAKQLGDETGLRHTTGSFSAAMAKLRKLQLIAGGNTAVSLSPMLREAVRPTVGIYDSTTGQSARVKV